MVNPSSRSSSLVASVLVTGTAASILGYYYRRPRSAHRAGDEDGKTNPQHAIPAALSESAWREELELAVALALQAGHRMKTYLNAKGTNEESELDDLGIAVKGERPEDFCTIIDVENERNIIQGLSQKFPTHHIIGEETVGTGVIPSLTAESPPTWIVDPIDGTTNFAAGLPLTCVSIGLCVDGRRPVLGVVYAPATEELYLAVAGHGAYRNGIRIVTGTAAHQRGENSNDAVLRLRDAVVCFEFGYARETKAIARMVAVVARILQHGCRATRSLGSGVLDLCYVATGRLDVVYAGVAGEGWKPWDYCAGVVIVQEAGGVVEAITTLPPENEFDLYSESIICAVNATLVKEVREQILAGVIDSDT